MTAEETRIDLIHPVCDDTPTLRVFQGPIEAVHLGSGFAVTGGADQKLRVWPLDFSMHFLEAEYEGTVRAPPPHWSICVRYLCTSRPSLGVRSDKSR